MKRTALLLLGGLVLLGCVVNEGDPGTVNDTGSTGADDTESDVGTGDSEGDSGSETGDTDFEIPEAACTAESACGGEVEGSWVVSSSCIEIGGTLDLTAFRLGCDAAEVSGTVAASGEWLAFSDDDFAQDIFYDKVSWNGEETVTFPPECLGDRVAGCDQLRELLITAGDAQGIRYGANYDDIVCADDLETGGCRCDLRVNHIPLEMGTYTVSDNAVATSAGDLFSYCIEGEVLVMTPKKYASGTTFSTTGTVVLVRDSSNPLAGRTLDLHSAEGFTPISSGMTLYIEFRRNELSIYTGCNLVTGNYTLCDTALCLSKMGTTSMACSSAARMEQERFLTEFFAADPAIEIDGFTVTFSSGDVRLVYRDAPVAGK